MEVSRGELKKSQIFLKAKNKHLFLKNYLDRHASKFAKNITSPKLTHQVQEGIVLLQQRNTLTPFDARKKQFAMRTSTFSSDTGPNCGQFASGTMLNLLCGIFNANQPNSRTNKN